MGSHRRQLRSALSVGALFADAADLACRELGFERGVVLSVLSGALHADTTDSLRNPDGDRLRREVLASPVELRPEASEAELIRLMRASHSVRVTGSSVLAETLALRKYALAPIVVESRTLAILVLDRAKPEIDALETAAIGVYAEVIASTLEHVVLRARQRELGTELQSLTLSTQALMREMLKAPVTLPSSGGQREAFPATGPVSPEASALRQRLSEGESRVAALLVQGRSNREIAEELILSPETVKATVARILRKLGVSNRVAAATLIVQLSGSDAA
jgi:DNA-binding NarL/FixJ family response regulator